MICHYGGVSSQLSPSNHPSYPSSRTQTPLQPSKNTFCIPRGARVSLAPLLPHLPLPPLHPTPGENIPAPPRSCSPPPQPPPTLTRDSEHIVCGTRTPAVCRFHTHKSRRLPKRAKRPKRTLNLSSSSSSGGTCEFWIRKRKSGTTETPADKHAHKSALTGIVYPSAVLFHHHGSEVTLHSTECSFL